MGVRYLEGGVEGADSGVGSCEVFGARNEVYYSWVVSARTTELDSLAESLRRQERRPTTPAFNGIHI